ncbi:peptidoglycan-binding protein [Falsiroseomonas sp.]|uniref:peptidoglycan-binding domain-containing protein n=1 Tax=Falsiroseomonas sp. TaxID=2870721 RepID=UPI002732BAEA|nr:peptidoglycan-binding domain-containing protein [Falsiroseomonas sp.]MDP3416842.1 peptidoglycan-binding domain-containing protein [Falsiroseomonas sp.]
MKMHGIAFGLLLGTQLALAPGLSLAQPAATLTYAQPLEREAVTKVQEALRRAGAYDGAVDGIWGPASRTALERFQQGRGLQVTGEMNQATAATLGVNPAELLPASRTPPASTEVLSERVVRNIQTRLRTLGFYEGGIDGLWGPATQTAIERFQQSRSLQVTGQLTPVTASAMGLDPNNLEAPPR